MSTDTPPEPRSRSPRAGFHWWWILLLVLLAGFALFGDKGVLRLIKTYQQRTELQRQVEDLVAENERLKQVIDDLKNDPATIERIARQELGMVRKDEIVYQFPNRDNSSAKNSKTEQ